MIWSFIQRFGSLVISFITNMVLARLLSPEDFGTVGYILVFMSFADVLVDSGLGHSLIQKKNISHTDISTIFTSNILLAIVIFALIFILAPNIANYIGIPDLVIYLRIEALTVLLRAGYVINNAILNKKLDFKCLTKVNVSAALLSSVIAIILAFLGCGIWSLIVKSIAMHATLLVLYNVFGHLKVSLKIDWRTLKELFGFGWFVALTNIIDLLYSNIVSFIMGKTYSVKELGYYTQANSLKQIPVYSISMVVTQVMFPVMSEIQDEKQKVRHYMKQSISIGASVVFPIMLFLIALAEPIIVFLYSAKWAPAGTYFQILCLAGMVNIIIHLNRSVLMALGYSKQLFRAQLIAILIGVAILLISLKYSVKIFVMSIVAYSFINWFIVSLFSGNKSGYTIIDQLRDIAKPLLLAITSYLLCIIIHNFVADLAPIVQIVLCFTVFFIAYILLNMVFKTALYKFCENAIVKRRKKSV